MIYRKSRAVAIFVLGALFVFAAAVLFGGGCGRKEAAPSERTVARTEPQPSRAHLDSDLIQGRRVFEEKHCNQCHAIFERNRKPGPRLATSRFYGSFLDIFSTLWNHAPAMRVFMRKEVLDLPQFSTTELNQLVSFLYMLPYLGEAGDPKKGEAILREKACFSCHSLGGRGKKGGISLDFLSIYQSKVVLLQRMWNHGPEMLREIEARGAPIPHFYGNEMTDLFATLTERTGEEKRKIFLGVGNVGNGRKLFADKGCITCHSIFGEGGKEAPDLGKAVSQSNVTVLITRLWNHAPQMRGKFQQKKLEWPRFTETEMNDLIVFLYSLNYEDKTGDPARGESFFTRNKCAGCHFKTDQDKREILEAVKTADPVLFATELWNHIPAMEAALVTQGVPWPNMSGQQMRDVLAFLQSQ
jgi:cytochrome c2